jgi:predicted O-methyltransferase YrrM
MELYEQYQHRLTGDWSDIQGHMEFLYTSALERPVMVELGVRSGNSTCALLAAVEKNGLGSLWSVDISEPDVPESWYALKYWHLLVCDDTSTNARLWLPSAIDLLFIDTSHTVAQTLMELELYVPRVRPGGLVLLHDTEWLYPDVQLSGPIGDVAKALDEYCAKTERSWYNRPGSYGMGVIAL